MNSPGAACFSGCAADDPDADRRLPKSPSGRVQPAKTCFDPSLAFRALTAASAAVFPVFPQAEEFELVVEARVVE